MILDSPFIILSTVFFNNTDLFFHSFLKKNFSFILDELVSIIRFFFYFTSFLPCIWFLSNLPFCFIFNELFIQKHTITHAHTIIYTHTRTCAHTNIYIYIYIYMYIYVYVCVCVCVYAYNEVDSINEVFNINERAKLGYRRYWHIKALWLSAFCQFDHQRRNSINSVFMLS